MGRTRSLAGLLIGAMLLPGAAGATAPQSQQDSAVTIEGSVGNSCKLGAWSFTTLSGSPSFDGTSTVSVNMDPDGDGELEPFGFELSASAVCNFTHKLFFQPGAQNNGLHNPISGAVPAGFTPHVNYQATLAGWLSPNLIITTNGSATNTTPHSGTTVSPIDPKSGTLVVRVTDPQPAGGPLLLAGTYSDQIFVRIGDF